MRRKHYNWQLPDELERRLGETTYGRQRAMFEADHLLGVYQRELDRYEKDPKTASTIIGKTKLPKGVSAAQLVAWFHVSHILMNLDEMITKG